MEEIRHIYTRNVWLQYMITPPQEKSCDFIAVSGCTLLACPQPQKLGCCRMWGKPKLYQVCLLIRNFTSCIFFPSHIRAEVCFKMAFVVMRVRTGCTRSESLFSCSCLRAVPDSSRGRVTAQHRCWHHSAPCYKGGKVQLPRVPDHKHNMLHSLPTQSVSGSLFHCLPQRFP